MKPKLLLVLAMVLFAVVVAIKVAPLRYRSAPNACINILRQIDGAKLQWAFENHKNLNDVPTWAVIAPYLKRDSKCEQGGSYTLGRVADLPTCSFASHKLPPREAGELLWLLATNSTPSTADPSQ